MRQPRKFVAERFISQPGGQAPTVYTDLDPDCRAIGNLTAEYYRERAASMRRHPTALPAPKNRTVRQQRATATARL